MYTSWGCKKSCPHKKEQGAEARATVKGPFSPFLCLRLFNSLIRLLTRLSALFYIRQKHTAHPSAEGPKQGFYFVLRHPTAHNQSLISILLYIS